MDKKALREQVEAKIETALAEFAKDVSEKKFKKHIKKAAKIVSDGLTMPEAKKAAAPKKAKATAKKAAPKKEGPKKETSKKEAPKKESAPKAAPKKAGPKKAKKTAVKVVEEAAQ